MQYKLFIVISERSPNESGRYRSWIKRLTERSRIWKIDNLVAVERIWWSRNRCYGRRIDLAGEGLISQGDFQATGCLGEEMMLRL
ncbi:hypothetical protein RHMOL_Rhmol10G0173600 [Rhododendron molle]|uniref:Uncharacterized protein n=1 Tax=Rhododendron molle TaxID=49168 RepID=A0ACC0M4V1_RHOML|nr:hypothetical protein RHMOL_Rhmol10G0173600 [Rhododendron molle]